MQQVKDLECLDSLIAKVGSPDDGVHSEGPCAALIEHLRAARQELMGSMRTEYSVSLRQAADAVGCVPDENTRGAVEKSLRALMDELKR